jgi:hypothetical protein
MEDRPGTRLFHEGDDLCSALALSDLSPLSSFSLFFSRFGFRSATPRRSSGRLGYEFSGPLNRLDRCPLG